MGFISIKFRLKCFYEINTILMLIFKFKNIPLLHMRLVFMLRLM